MANEIGFSTIYPGSGLGSAGPIGATGATGANQTIRGSTGATGLDSNYITSVFVNQETGKVEFTLSDGTAQSPGNLIGVTGVYAGVTAFSLGSGTSILRGVCGGITLDFYNFRTDGLLGITYSIDGALVFTISANSGVGGISASTENDRIVYAQSKTTIMSTDLIPEASNGTNRVSGGSNYGYINFGGETAGRNIVADIIESSLSVGPIERGGFDVTLSDFYVNGVEGITLDVSRATVYNLVTPIGIKAFTTSNIIEIPDGQVMSVTLIVHGEDVWNFPEDVVFDAESKPIFYPGVNILHMWRTNVDGINGVWRASFTARGIGAENITNPGVRGSCCYFDVDGTKHCDEYVTQTYCTERIGNFEAMIPCDKNSCIVGEETTNDGVCCTEGKCVSDIDPNLCQTIGGYFISGITCGQFGAFPEGSTTGNIGADSGLCFNTCKPSNICCLDGTCLGQLTEAHCDYLGGTSVIANNCSTAKCCDHIIAPGACCVQEPDGTYTCTEVNTPYECNNDTELNGIYMGKNTTCNIEEDICCTVANQLTCYECKPDSSPCGCTEIPTTGNSCSEVNPNFYEDRNTCNATCSSKQCHKCDGTTCIPETTACGVECSDIGFESGPCLSNTCLTKTCFETCINGACRQNDVLLTDGDDNSCATIGGIFNLDACDCVPPPPEDPEFAACFWCFPILLNSDPTVVDQAGNRLQELPNAIPSPSDFDFVRQVAGASQAPFRSVFSVPRSKALLLDAAAGYVDNNIQILFNASASAVGITLPAGLNPAGYSLFRDSNILYYDETNTSAFTPSFIGTSVPNNIGEVLNATISTVKNRDINFRCSYVGSYEKGLSTETRENCLKRYGYTTPEELANCLLCDPVNDNISYTDLSNEDPLTLNKIEPYQDRIKAGLYAPFPPLWGRITYKYGRSSCTTAVYKKNTYNLKLISDSNTRNLVTAFITQQGKTWLKPFLDTYDTVVGKNKELWDGLISSMDRNFVGTIVTTPVSANEFCMGSDNNGNTIFKYDPYKLGGLIDYGASYVWPSRIGDGCCLIPTSSWALPQPSIDTIEPSASGASSAAMYYPPNATGGANERIQSVGERYLRKLNSGTNDTSDIQFVRGIFGRNLRYNLDSFRTSTVFYHNDGTGTFITTMKTNENIKIPLAYQNGFSSTSSCSPVGGNLDAPLCEQDQGGAPAECAAQCGCPPDCVETTPGQCEGIGGGPCLAQYNGGGGGPASTWQGSGGLIAPSTVETPSPFKAQVVNKSEITSKRVYIIPGVCVDMLCPDCNSYESC